MVQLLGFWYYQKPVITVIEEPDDSDNIVMRLINGQRFFRYDTAVSISGETLGLDEVGDRFY